MPASDWADWDDVFHGLPPVGFILREQCTTHHWLRLHSLPGSQRYPTTSDEMSEVLRRANAAASALFGDGGEVGVHDPFW